MGNFDPVNESTENSRVKLLQIRVLLHGSDKRLDIGFLLLLLLQILALAVGGANEVFWFSAKLVARH